MVNSLPVPGRRGGRDRLSIPGCSCLMGATLVSSAALSRAALGRATACHQDLPQAGRGAQRLGLRRISSWLGLLCPRMLPLCFCCCVSAGGVRWFPGPADPKARGGCSSGATTCRLRL